jgi:glutamyl-tRNA reductase
VRIRILGTSHQQAPVGVRERLAVPEDALPSVLRSLRALAGVREIVVVSTCNRVELVLVDDGACAGLVEEALAARAGLRREELSPYLRRFDDDAALRHLFRVCSSLDSMILGESQINGQVKESYRLADENGSVGPVLHRLFHKAFSVAKRVRTETGVGSATVSVAAAAVGMAGTVFEELPRHTVMLLGAGEMAELALRGFRNKGCRDLYIANRTMERAAELAAPLEAAVLPWQRRAEFLETADIVVCSTAAPEPVLTGEDVARARKRRRGRPLLLVDISVPRNLDPGIGKLDGVYLFDIDDLGRVVEQNQEARKKEAEAAERIVAEEVARFSRMLSQVQVAPLLRALGQKAARDGRKEVERTMQGLDKALTGLPEGARTELERALDRMSQSIAKRFLADPMQRARQLGEAGDLDRLSDLAAALGIDTALLSVGEMGEEGGAGAAADSAPSSRTGSGS